MSLHTGRFLDYGNNSNTVYLGWLRSSRSFRVFPITNFSSRVAIRWSECSQRHQLQWFWQLTLSRSTRTKRVLSILLWQGPAMESVFQMVLGIWSAWKEYSTNGSVFKTFALSIDILIWESGIKGKCAKLRSPKTEMGGCLGSNTFWCKSPNVDLDVVDCSCDAGCLVEALALDSLWRSFFLFFFLFTIFTYQWTKSHAYAIFLLLRIYEVVHGRLVQWEEPFLLCCHRWL